MNERKKERKKEREKERKKEMNLKGIVKGASSSQSDSGIRFVPQESGKDAVVNILLRLIRHPWYRIGKVENGLIGDVIRKL
jgi:hypothetical protein